MMTRNEVLESLMQRKQLLQEMYATFPGRIQEIEDLIAHFSQLPEVESQIEKDQAIDVNAEAGEVPDQT